MNGHIKTGISFGLTSASITTVGFGNERGGNERG